MMPAGAGAPRDIEGILAGLRHAPDILENLIAEVPPALLKVNRKPGKWCIHSHACHLAIAQPIMQDRLERFIREDRPEFKPYFPDKVATEDDLLALDLQDHLRLFRDRRAEFSRKLDGLAAAGAAFWDKAAVHPEYESYTPRIMVRHIAMHDYLHMYRIEELWLTRPEYL